MNSNEAGRIIGGSIILILIVGLISLGLAILIYWTLFTKAGYSGWRFLWMFVPIANIVVWLMYVFGEWPIQRELNALRQQVARQGGGYPPQYSQQYGQPMPGQQYPSGPQYGNPGQQYPSGPQYPQR